MYTPPPVISQLTEEQWIEVDNDTLLHGISADKE
jgi:hypothetical protein